MFYSRRFSHRGNYAIDTSGIESIVDEKSLAHVERQIHPGLDGEK